LLGLSLYAKPLPVFFKIIRTFALCINKP
jgi:hypothetical protein